MGVTAVVASAAALLARLLIPSAEYIGLRVLLLPLTALAAYLVVVAPTVRTYGAACMATICLVSVNSYLGALGTDRPLLYFVPAAIIIVISSSFFWISSKQWIGGALASYAPFLPFAIEHTATRADMIFSVLFAMVALVTGFVTHLRIQDFQRRAFEQEVRLARLSGTDALTGAQSRREFLLQVERAAVKAREVAAPLTLLYLDLDHFKRLNDTHGHAAGDAVLRAMSGVLQQALRENDLLGRLGGEEFCVLLFDQDENSARDLAERLRVLLAAVPRPDQQLTFSAGVAGMRAGEPVLQTLHRADMAMLKAKKAGRDTVRIASETRY